MMRRENGHMLIDISEDEYNWLLLVLGFATSAAYQKKDSIVTFARVLTLTNTINEGNPDWTPYEVPK